MRMRLSRLGVLMAGVIALVAIMVPPASATTYKLLTFTGRIVHSHGLGYPCTPLGTLDCLNPTAPTVKVGPKNEPQVNLTPGGNTAGFGLSSFDCVKTSVSTPDKPRIKTSPADLCVLTATGIVTGYCSLSTGTGFAKLINLTSYKDLIELPFKFTNVGGLYHFSGGNKATNFYAEVSAVSDVETPGGPSCTNKTATGFVVTGYAVYKDCTRGTTAGVCSP